MSTFRRRPSANSVLGKSNLSRGCQRGFKLAVVAIFGSVPPERQDLVAAEDSNMSVISLY